MSQVSARFEQYRSRYRNIALEREDGILTLRLHTDGGPFVWSFEAHEELAYCFADVATDRDNKVVVITGTGASWCVDINAASFKLSSPSDWDHIISDGRRLLGNPDGHRSAGDCRRQRAGAHPPGDPGAGRRGAGGRHGAVPGCPALHVRHRAGGRRPCGLAACLGPNRGRYFLVTGQELDARTALDYGVVSEVLAPGKLMDRAHELARYIAGMPALTRRYTRLALSQRIKRLLHEGLGYGLAYEALAAIDQLPVAGRMKDVR